MRPPDPKRSRVVLIGTSRFSDNALPDLPNVKRVINDLRLAFADPAHETVPRDGQECVTLLDEGDIREVGHCLGAAADEAQDLLLIYYAGHGLLAGRRQELYLGLPDSNRKRPGFNALRYEDLRDAVLDSKAATKVVILDCDLPEGETKEIGIEGASVLTSAHNPEFPRQLLRMLTGSGAGVDYVARQMLLAIADPGQPVEEWMLDWLYDNADELIGRAPQVAADLLDRTATNVPFDSDKYAWLTSRLAHALFFIGDMEQAQQVAKLTLERSIDPDLLVHAHSTLAQCLGISGSADDATKTLGFVLKSPGLSARQRARLQVPAARTHFHLGEFAKASEVATDALASASTADDTWAMGWALNVMASTSVVQGRLIDGLSTFDRALAIAQSDPALTDLQLLVQVNRAAALGNLGRYEEALDVSRQAQVLARRCGTTIRIAQADSVLAGLQFETGQWNDALAGIAHLADDLQEPAGMCNDLGNAAVIHFHRNEPRAAQRCMAAARPHAENLGRRFISQWALAQSMDHELDGDHDAALAALMVGLGDDIEEHGEIDFVLADAVRLAVLTGDKDTAQRLAEHAARLAERSEIPHRLGNDLYCRGLLESDPETLMAAAGRYEEAQRPLFTAMAYEAAAGLFLLSDDEESRKQGREAMIRSVEAYEFLGATADVARLQTEFRRHGIRRGPQPRSRRAQSGWESLTPTEEKVAALVSEGLSNPEVAERLGMSRRTVGTHVSHILKKLEVSSRADIARESALRTVAREVRP